MVEKVNVADESVVTQYDAVGIDSGDNELVVRPVHINSQAPHGLLGTGYTIEWNPPLGQAEHVLRSPAEHAGINGVGFSGFPSFGNWLPIVGGYQGCGLNGVSISPALCCRFSVHCSAFLDCDPDSGRVRFCDFLVRIWDPGKFLWTPLGFSVLDAEVVHADGEDPLLSSVARLVLVLAGI